MPPNEAMENIKAIGNSLEGKLNPARPDIRPSNER